MTTSLATAAATVAAKEAVVSEAFLAAGGGLSVEDAVGMMRHLDPATAEVPASHLEAALRAHLEQRQTSPSPTRAPMVVTHAALAAALASRSVYQSF